MGFGYMKLSLGPLRYAAHVQALKAENVKQLRYGLHQRERFCSFQRSMPDYP